MLEILKHRKEVYGEAIIDMNELQTLHPEMFRPDNSMIYHLFEEKIRPFNFIYVRQDVNSLSFTLQKGKVPEVGKNGCNVADIIAVTKLILEGLSKYSPNEANSRTIECLEQALMWQGINKDV